MRTFFERHQYLIVWILGLTIIGSLAAVMIQMNEYIPQVEPAHSRPIVFTQADPVIPAAPSVTLTIEQQGKNKGLRVHWQNLPTYTTSLGIFRKLTGSTTTGELMSIIHISADELIDGNSFVDLGDSKQDGYSFYAEAFGGGGGGAGGEQFGNASTSASSTVLWTSDVIIPIPPTPTSTNQGSGGGGGGGNQNPATSSNATTTPPGNNATSSQDPGTGNGNGSGPGGTTPSSTGGGSGPSQGGSFYYTPQVQGIGGSVDRGTFWVQHTNQNIEISWQNLPANVTNIVIARSEDKNGPWNQILQEKNPSTTGSSSIQLVDGTLGDPYYYQMTAFTESTTIATYGPEYLPPVGN